MESTDVQRCCGMTEVLLFFLLFALSSCHFNKNNSNADNINDLPPTVHKEEINALTLSDSISCPIIKSEPKGSKQISVFDPFFKEYARQINWDWRLLASIAYWESRFFTDRKSKAGAAGLMGLMPRTAKKFGLTIDEIYDPEKNIKAASEFIKSLNRTFGSIENEDERIRFILAAYNSGVGHIFDAQALAKKFGKNPKKWKDVEEFLKLKNLPEYYDDPVCKFGYFRSTETISFVQKVIARWNYYLRIMNYEL